jgi:hypothetical protein
MVRAGCLGGGVVNWRDWDYDPGFVEAERATMRRSLVESIGDEFAKCLTDGRLAEVVADWPGEAPAEVTS